MKNIFKKAISILLITVMVLCSAPLSGFVGIELPSFGELFGIKAKAYSYSGSCGNGVYYGFDETTNTLYIYGNGTMDGYGIHYASDFDYRSPWLRLSANSKINIENVHIGSGVENIGSYAFYTLRNIKSVVFEENSELKTIGDSAFRECYSLNNIIIPDSVTSIESNAFYSCKALVGDLTILQNVTTIGNSAFGYCVGLTSVTIPVSVTSIGTSAFTNCKNIKNVSINANITSILAHCFSGCYGIENLVIPEGVTTIEDLAFNNCNRPKQIAIPSNLKRKDISSQAGHLQFRQECLQRI